MAVRQDVPLFLVTPLLRPWHVRWGATPEEVAAGMPGDDLLPAAQYRCTRAITVRATPDEVWPWLVQVGVGRAGWYADDLLDNYGRPSAGQVLPHLQDLHVGQRLPWVRHPSERTQFVVDSYTAPERLLWRTPDRTWAWRLVGLPGGGTRVITRMRVRYEWPRPSTLLTVLLMEVADFAMTRRMLHGIRDRVEPGHRSPTPAAPEDRAGGADAGDPADAVDPSGPSGGHRPAGAARGPSSMNPGDTTVPDPPGERGADMSTPSGDTLPTIVLVHGAWADASGFATQISALQDRGFRAIGFANPLRGLGDDARYLSEFVRTLDGPVVLVGHSYGGAVISSAAAGNAQVTALVFFSGWMPDEGESIAQVFDRHTEGSLVGPAIRPLPFTAPDGREGADLYLEPERFHAAFAADVDRRTPDVMAATQRPWTGAAFNEPSGPPAWRTLPCWYLLCTEDRAIPEALARWMAERAGATISEVPASHASMVSRPEAGLQLILRAAEHRAPAVRAG